MKWLLKAPHVLQSQKKKILLPFSLEGSWSELRYTFKKLQLHNKVTKKIDQTDFCHCLQL